MSSQILVGLQYWMALSVGMKGITVVRLLKCSGYRALQSWEILGGNIKQLEDTVNLCRDDYFKELIEQWPCFYRSYCWSEPTIPRVATPSPQLIMSPGQGRRESSPGRVWGPEGEGDGGYRGVAPSWSSLWTVESKTVKLREKSWGSTQICKT